MIRTKLTGPRSQDAEAVLCVTTLAILCMPPAIAEYGYDVGIDMTYSDNINLQSNDPQSDLLIAPFVDFSWAADTRTLSADVDGFLEYVEYLDGTNEDDVFGYVSARGDWRILPDRLNLHAENRYQQVKVDELEPESPANTEDVNTFIVGPDLLFDLSPVNRLTLGARYGQTYYERDTDSDRTGVGATLTHRFSEITEFAINAQRQDVEFTEPDPIAIDYTLDEVGIGLMRRLPSGELSGTVGERRIERDDGSTLDGGFGRVDWDYRATRRTELVVSAEHGLTDSGVRLLAQDETAVELPQADPFSSVDIVELTEASARLERDGSQMDLNVALRGREIDYDTRDRFDRDSLGLSVGAEWPLTGSVSVGGSLSVTRTDYTTIDRTDDDTVLGASARYLISRHYYAETGYTHWDRSSNRSGNSFDENRVYVRAAYRWGR